jgi:hypothetical protein
MTVERNSSFRSHTDTLTRPWDLVKIVPGFDIAATMKIEFNPVGCIRPRRQHV